MSKGLDDLGRAYAGSQLQVQIYVNRRPEELSQCVLDATPSLASPNAHLHWASPLEEEKFVEYQDHAFLEAVGLEHCYEALREFWPRRGPVWDALASVEFGTESDVRGVVLVEAKSHPPEIYGGGCQALSESRKRIEQALWQTKYWLHASDHADWTGPLYQSANRVAHLYFLREIVKVPAWLVNVYFLCDPHSPTTREGWQVALTEVKAELGLDAIVVPHTTELFLEARERHELTPSKDAEDSNL